MDIETERFTENLDKIHIMEQDNPFFTYLRGFMHAISEYEIIHAYYHKETKNIKFYVRKSTTPISKLGICEAWKQYNDNDNLHVTIYHSEYDSYLYECNDYETDSKEFYKHLIKHLIEQI